MASRQPSVIYEQKMRQPIAWQMPPIIELDTPTIGRAIPTKISLAKNKRWNGFSATNQVKARLHQTEPPNALPASERCPGQFYTARLTSNGVSSFCVRELSESWTRPGRNPFETWTIFVRGVAHLLDGGRAALAKQALPLKGTRGSVLRVKLRQVLRWFANAGAS